MGAHRIRSQLATVSLCRLSLRTTCRFQWWLKNRWCTRLITVGLESTIDQAPKFMRNFHLLFSSFEAPTGHWVKENPMVCYWINLRPFFQIYSAAVAAFVGTSWRTTMVFGHTYWGLSQWPRFFPVVCCHICLLGSNGGLLHDVYIYI